MNNRYGYDFHKTEQWVLESSDTSFRVDDATDVDSVLEDLSSEAMASPALKSSLSHYEELVRKQLSFTEDRDDNHKADNDDGVFDQPLTPQMQLGMRAVQSTLEKLDSKHGVLQRHASAECVRDATDDTDFLKRTMSDSIRQEKPTEQQQSETKPGKPVVCNGNGEKAGSPQTNRTSNTGGQGPQLKTPLTTNRTVAVSSSPPKKPAEPSGPVKASRIYNTEDSEKTPSLRHLLMESKAESSELRRQIEELVEENRKLKNHMYSSGGSAPTDAPSYVYNKLSEAEKRNDNLLREKEILATELWKLRQQVEDLVNSKSELGSEIGDTKADRNQHRRDEDALDSYRPDNPDVLQRRIEDLESQIQDLMEANETSSAEILRLDQENQMLTAHIKRLQSERDLVLEAERDHLKQQLSEVQERQQNGNDDEILHLKSEIAQLQIDIKAMQDKTNILQDENVKLRESLKEAKSNNKWKGSGSSVNDTAAAKEAQLQKEAAWEEITNLKQRIKEFTSKSPFLTPSTKGLTDKSVNSKYSGYNHREVNGCSLNVLQVSPSKDISERPVSPSSRSDISESTTVLMAGFDAYKPSTKIGIPALLPSLSKRIEDDRISECTLDILNEASYSSHTYGLIDGLDGTASESSKFESYPAYKSQNGNLETSSSESVQEKLLSPSSYGLRSSLAPIQPTQQNKSLISPPRISLSTTGRRPFAPRSPADLAIGDIAKFTKPDGRICKGVVKFIGHLHDKNDTYIGLELEQQDGKHDGTYDGVRYFSCKPNKGLFITFNKVIMVWGS